MFSLEFLEYGFMLRALGLGALIAVAAAMVGTSLVLRKNSMIGDGLSHVAFGAFVVATILQMAPIEFALPVVTATSVIILRSKQRLIQNDAMIAILSASALAIGTFLLSVTKGVNTDMNNYLFGSILAIKSAELWMGSVLLLVVVGLYVVAHRHIFALTFDEEFAHSTGVNVTFYDTLFAVICSVIIVLGMRLVGALLISSLLIFPAVTAMQVAKTYNHVVIFAIIFAVISFIAGLMLSFNFNTPTGASIVIVNLAALLLTRCVVKLKRW